MKKMRYAVIGTMLIASASGSAQTDLQRFFDNPLFPTITGPSRIAMIDVNSDLIRDVVVVSRENPGPLAGALGFHLVDAEGRIGPLEAQFTLLGPAFSHDSGDVNGDGLEDMVIAFRNDGAIAAYLNTGSAQFIAAASVASAQPIGIALGDLNLDGVLDVVAANQGKDTISTHLGNGDGTFQSAVTYPAGDSPFAIDAADLNGDGFDDVVVYSDRLRVYHAVPDNSGVLGTPLVYLAFGITDIVIADLDLDTHPDIVAANNDFEDGEVHIRLNSGHGTFPQRMILPSVSEPFHAAVADMNIDGLPDIIVVGENPERLSIWYQQAGAKLAFQHEQQWLAHRFAFSVLVHDINNDCLPDVLWCSDVRDRIGLVLGAPDGDVLGSGSIFADQPEALTVADFDEDGILDVAGVGASPTFVAFGRPGIGLTNLQLLSGGGKVIASTDFNGDGHIDLVMAIQDSFFSAPGRGDGTFEDATEVAIVDGASSIAVGEVNGDSNLDVVVASNDTGKLAASVLLGDGRGNFVAQMVPLGVAQRAIAVADLDGDTNDDIAFSTSVGVKIALGNGDGTFQPPLDTPLDDLTSNLLAVDFDGNGAIDLIAPSITRRIEILLNDGTGSLSIGHSIDTPSGVAAVSLADIDGDGLDDLIASSGSDETLIIRQTAPGVFDEPRGFIGAEGSFRHAVGDFDADGDLDIVTAGSDEMCLGVHTNQRFAEYVSAAHETLTIAFGTSISGDVTSLTRCDGHELRIRSQFGFSAAEPNLTQIDLTSRIDHAGPYAAHLTGILRSRLDNPGGIHRIRLRNVKTGDFDEVATLNAALVAETRQFGPLEASSYLDATDHVETSIRSSVVATFSALGFEASFDLLHVHLH